ncbi:vitamin K epoxide reductase family protein [Roseimaritima ulvae]|uniref:Vitamin K epoxide reductase family protein n=1 Tax=Roseimaritima ulvae TaxID=980254 RepID=A0A5B9QT26_9BACT|nr:vitamin K epoxide reductase family protein [Roseimaritima ulvae]QEG40890.1 Vitamin K epoxide reductase family protein [Roseimaritima ulvae]
MHEKHSDNSGDNESHQHEMTGDDRLSMLEMHHKQTLWVYWTLPLLGFWLLLAPFNFGYLNESLWVDPSGGRGPWFAEESTPELRQLRAWLMTVSDVLSGLLLVVFGYRTLKPNRPYSLWACCFVGVWLTLAPVVFWAPTAASYANDSFVGILVMALTILIPGMPNMIMFMQHGPSQPPGWSYNPSSWPQRWIMIATGFLGFIVSRYLAMFQLGYIDYVWDPFFGFASNTEKVLNSKMSHMWPVSDGGLGAVSYTFEFLMGYMGSPSRWRTMPWMVAFFGVLVIPLGLTHIFLVISQPLIVHAWCTLCLLAALIMLPMIPLEVDEVIAMIQHVRQAKKRGDREGSLWSIFWKGGQADGCTPDDRSPAMVEFSDHPVALFKASIWGMSFPWTLLACSALGVIPVFLPTLFGIDITTTAADIGHLCGALIVTFSVISMGEVIRTGRFLNVVLALMLVVGPWLVDGTTTAYALAASALGIAVAMLSIPRGRILQTYGSWDRFIR